MTYIQVLMNYDKLYDITKITQLHNRIDLGIIVWIGAVLVNVLIHQNYNSIIEFLGQSYLVCLYFIIRIAFFSFSENKIINILEILFTSDAKGLKPWKIGTILVLLNNLFL